MAELLTAEQREVEGPGAVQWASQLNSTVARSAVKAHSGSSSLAITATAAGAMGVQLAAPIPVAAPGSSYTASAYLLEPTATGHFPTFYLRFLDSSSALVQDFTSSPGESTTVWQQGSKTATAPAGTAYATVIVQWFAMGAGEVAYLDTASLFETVAAAGMVPRSPRPPVRFPPAQRRGVALPPGPQLAPPPRTVPQRAARFGLPVRARRVEPPWPQAVPPVNPPIVFAAGRGRSVRGFIVARRRSPQIPAQQLTAPSSLTGRRRFPAWPARGRVVPPVPTQQAVPANPPIVFVLAQRRAARGFIARGRLASAPPTQVPSPAQQVAARRRFPVPSAKGRAAQPVPAQQTPPPNPPIVFAGQRKDRRGLSSRPTRAMGSPLPASVAPPSPRASRRSALVGMARGRFVRPVSTQTAPVNPPIVLVPIARRVLRGAAAARSRRIEPPWQSAVPVVSPRTPDSPGRRRGLCGLTRKGQVTAVPASQVTPLPAARRQRPLVVAPKSRTVAPPWQQTSPPANPPLVFRPVTVRRVAGLVFRGRHTDTPMQQAVPSVGAPRRRLLFALQGRARTVAPPWVQAALPPSPLLVANPSQRRSVRGWVVARSRAAGFPWSQQVAPPPTRDLLLRFGGLSGRWQYGNISGRWRFGGLMTKQQSVLSREYVRCPVSATVAGVTVNPTGDSVQMAFMPSGVNPAAADFVSASWETGTSGSYWVICLVGPGGTVSLIPGRYDVWVKVTDSPEIPAVRVDILVIT